LDWKDLLDEMLRETEPKRFVKLLIMALKYWYFEYMDETAQWWADDREIKEIEKKAKELGVI